MTCDVHAAVAALVEQVRAEAERELGHRMGSGHAAGPVKWTVRSSPPRPNPFSCRVSGDMHFRSWTQLGQERGEMHRAKICPNRPRTFWDRLFRRRIRRTWL